MDVKKTTCGILLTTAIFLLIIIDAANSQMYRKLYVDIHYESRCPDSRNFIQNHLKYTYPKIKDNVVLNFIPFGKASSYNNNGVKFNCQHGPRECEGNLFQSCVLDIIGPNSQDLQVDFVVCAMDFSKNPFDCPKSLGIDSNSVNECMKNGRGVQLQLKAEQDSAGIINRSGFVPTIVYDGIYNGREFWKSLEDFDSVVSNKLRSF